MTVSLPRSVVWENNQLWLLDQTLLPHETLMFHCESVATVFAAIQALKVRGAPAIGIAAAYGMVIDWPGVVSLTGLQERARYLISARPTAVNLAWAVNRILAVATANVIAGEVPLALLRAEAEAIHDEDKQACRAIGDNGVPLLKDRPNLLTHCNAGSLAVSEYGTALAPIYRAHEQGRELHVFVDETRPLLQGARLTSYELASAGVPHTLIADNMAAHVMSQGKVDAVIVGCDRVARNGDVANKIGTLNLAILCQHFAIPFYVACPISTIDIDTATGAEIAIESRHADEVRGYAGTLASRHDAPVFNPAFDVTPAALVSALITEAGVLHQPDEKSILDLIA